MQPQGHMQVLMNMLVFGLDPQTALDAPRICIQAPHSSGQSTEGEDEVYFEEGIPQSTIKALEKLGHNVYYWRDSIGECLAVDRLSGGLSMKES